MSSWTAWTAEAFAHAKSQGKPIIATIGPLPPEVLAALQEVIDRSFVAILADPETRPDAAARIGAGHAVILDSDGGRRAVMSLSSATAVGLERLALEALTPLPPVAPNGPAWTGAVRETELSSAPDEAKVSAVFAALPSLPAAADAELVEALLHAAGERGDAEARAALTRSLEVRAAGWDTTRRVFLSGSGSPLSIHARWAALYWDAFALTGETRWRELATGASDHLLRVLWDGSAGAFRRASALPSAG